MLPILGARLTTRATGPFRGPRNRSRMNQEQMSIEAVLRELQIDEAELEELIEDGDLHPKGEGAARRFSADEVHEIKAKKEGYPTIPLPDIEDIRDLDLGIGTPISFGPDRNQGLNTVYYVTVKDGKLTPVTDWSALIP